MFGNRIRGHCARHSKLYATLLVFLLLVSTQGVAAAGGGLEFGVDPQYHDTWTGP